MTNKEANKSSISIPVKSGANISVMAMLALLLLSLLYYRERMLFIDAPHILFRIINDGKLQITEHRYGSFITQLFPLLSVKAGLSLRATMMLYSASFYLFFLGTGLAMLMGFRQYGMAILLCLYLTLFTSDTFFWPNNEVHQGIAWLFIAMASVFCLATKKKTILTAAAFTGLFFLALWTHPLVMFPALYLWLFFWSSDIRWPFTRVQSIMYSIILLALSFVKLNYGMHHGYDSGKIEMVTQFSPRKIIGVFSSPQFRFLVKSCITNYWLLVVISVAGLITLIRERKFLLLGLTISFASGYLILICITYWDATQARFYIESEYMPLSVICAAPFVYFTLPRMPIKIVTITLILIFSVRLGYIINSAPLFTKRIALVEGVLDKMKTKGLDKIIIRDDNKGVDEALLMNWGAPVESVILSQLRNEVPQRTFIFLDTAQLHSFNTTSSDTLLGSFEKRSARQINGKYFTIGTAKYVLTTYDSLMK
jgi:hypothetical protein